MANKKILILILIFLPFFSLSAQIDLGKSLAGQILLQVEENGEAWYVNPGNYYRYYLGRPEDAFKLMQSFGQGISNENLKKIPIGLIDYGFNVSDSDADSLPDLLETAIGTKIDSKDSDSDGYADQTEIMYGYNPLGPGLLLFDLDFANQHKGKILLQTEANGEAWYLNPVDKKRYYLMRPCDAFTIMRQFGLGINNINLATIQTEEIITETQIKIIKPEADACATCGQNQSAKAVFESTISSLEKGETEKVISQVEPGYKIAAKSNMDYMGQTGMKVLAEFMKNSVSNESSGDKAVYTVRFQSFLGENTHDYVINKQSDGSWKLANF